MQVFKHWVVFLWCCSSLGSIEIAMAQEAKLPEVFPNRVIRLVVPFTAGGPADALARNLAEGLNKRFQYQVIVENRPGANTAIASQYVAKSPPDGYTLLLGSDAGMSLAPATQKNLSYDPGKDFVGVAMLAQLTQILFVNSGVPAKSVQELANLARTSSGGLSYASIGKGSQSHVSMEALNQILKVQMIHVPYTGAANAITDMLGGSVQVMMASIATPLPHIKSGKLRALAIAGPERSKELPDVPSFSESGVAGFESRGWFGIVAPAKTPPQILNILSRDIWAVVQSEPFISQAIEDKGFDIPKVSPAEFPDFLAKDRMKWKTIVDKLGSALN